jgi:hypothetical protein
VPQFGQKIALAGNAKPQFEHAYGAASTAGCAPVAPANGGTFVAVPPLDVLAGEPLFIVLDALGVLRVLIGGVYDV